MKLKDLTKEHGIEVVKLLWPFHDWFKSDFKFDYFNGDYGQWKDEKDELVSISFEAQVDTTGKVSHLSVDIYPTLDVYIASYDWVVSYWKHNTSYPNRNQFKIQEKFREWDIQPDFSKVT